MRKLFQFIALLIWFESFGQENIAIIKDPDGFTNVRVEGLSNAKIVARIGLNEPFTFTETEGDWWKVSKPTSSNPLEGFVHKSRIQPVDDLNDKQKSALFKNIFTTELAFIKAKNWGDAYNNHHEPIFDFILQKAADFIIRTRDNELMEIFVWTIKLNQGSADEHPPGILGYIYLKTSDWTIDVIKKVGPDPMLVDLLTFGFSNAVSGRETKIPNYEELKKKIEVLR
jgi:hypothetical protein